ncbi:MAG: GNAT family N-acetyltransferase [Calditrichaeota bacterium]|nr:MAG: GNAT family N-acetyltransferase [Calditrichota bacterium]
MNDFKTKIATNKDFKRISEFIFEISKFQEKQCIHSSIGETVKSLVNEFEELANKDELFCVFSENPIGEVCGFLACEFDRESKRGWLKGPLAENNNEEIYQELLDILVMELPIKIDKFSAFPNLKNQDLTRFYLSNDFEKDDISFIYEFHKCQIGKKGEIDKLFREDLPTENESDFKLLHEEAFPNTYYTVKEILALVDENHKILTLVKDEILLGYIYLSNDVESRIVDFEFITIRSNIRGKGFGRKLISSAISYSFNKLKTSKVTLTVTSKNNKAKKLYEEIGFQLLYSGISLHRKN